MRKWFKASIILMLTGIIVFLIDLVFYSQIDRYFGYGRVSIFDTYPNVSLIILLIVVIVVVLACFSFFMGAKPVLDRELFGKKAHYAKQEGIER